MIVAQVGCGRAYKQLATVLLVANSALSAAPLVGCIVAAKVGKFSRAPMEWRVPPLAAFLSLVTAAAREGRGVVVCIRRLRTRTDVRYA